MTKLLWLLAVTLRLGGAPASSTLASSCERRCEQSADQCRLSCREHAGRNARYCAPACGRARQHCVERCAHRPRFKEGRR